MFHRTIRPSPFWAAAALLALLLAAPHTLLAQTAPKTVSVELSNWTAKPVEIVLIDPDGNDMGYEKTVHPGSTFRTRRNDLTQARAKGYKWVARDPATKKVLNEIAADKGSCSFSVGEELLLGRVLELINEHRKANGKGPLSVDSKLTKAARDHSEWMASPSGKYDHTGKNGSRPKDRIKAAGAVFKVSAENIAKWQPIPQGVFDCWKNSAGHNQIMLGASYRKVGIAFKGCYWTVVFTD
jgi:uncharacterized protein YkwD